MSGGVGDLQLGVMNDVEVSILVEVHRLAVVGKSRMKVAGEPEKQAQFRVSSFESRVSLPNFRL